eukprot:g20320.t1
MFGLWSLRPELCVKLLGCEDDKGKLHVVSFVRSEVVAEEMMTPRSTKSSQKDATKGKVLVTWDVEPERFMPKLDHLRGHRWIPQDLDAAPVKEKKSLPSLSRDRSDLYSFSRLQDKTAYLATGPTVVLAACPVLTKIQRCS